MTLNEILEKTGKTVNDIASIYHGKDNWCRCGCGGNYFRPGDKGFKRAINAMNKENFYCFDVDYAPNNVNIPTDYDNNKCYCVYFDND